MTQEPDTMKEFQKLFRSGKCPCPACVERREENDKKIRLQNKKTL